MIDEVKGLTGGRKQFWLRVHRKRVENYLAVNGREKTKKEFNITEATLDRFLARKGNDDRVNKLSANDRYVLGLAMEASRTVASRVRMLEDRVESLEEFKEQIRPILDIGRAIAQLTSPINSLEVEKLLETHDPLRLDSLSQKSKKHV